MKLLSFSGLRRVGKTEAANIVVSLGVEMGIVIKRVSFADSLRELFSLQTGIAVGMLEAAETKEDFRPRILALGKKLRAEDPQALIKELSKTLTPGLNYCIDDTRLIEELAFVVRAGGKPFKVEADNDTRKKRGWKYDPSIDEDMNETELRGLTSFTFHELGGGVAYNNKTIEDLRGVLTPIVKEVFVGRVLA